VFLIRLLFKPFAIIGAIVGMRLGRSVFDKIWSAVDGGPVPEPGTGDGGVAKVVASHVLRAGVMAGCAAAVDRAFAGTFHYLIGAWPSEKPQTESDG